MESTLTGQQLLQGLSQFLNDWESRTTTSAGAADGSTLVDTYLKRYQDSRLQGRIVRVTSSGANQYTTQSIDNNSQSSGTVTLTGPFDAQVGTGVSYEIHRYDPAKKFRALDEARFDVSDFAYRYIYDETTTADGNTWTFPIPSTIALGPALVFEEVPVNANLVIWNFVTSPIGDSTSPWTATNCTASIININYTDLIVPKYDYASTRIQVANGVAATYAQPVAQMANGVTASLAAGREMAGGMWVYCRESGRVTLSITDDAGTATSDAHGGMGWELLTFEREIDQDNSTTLTFTLNVSSGDPLTLYWNRAWLYYGKKERITECYSDEAIGSVRRDATTQTIALTRYPERGHQLRFMGQQFLSELGSDPDTQVTNTMEVTEDTARMVYARAAELVLEWEGMVAQDVPEVYQRINTVRSRMTRVDKFRQQPQFRHVSSPYMR